MFYRVAEVLILISCFFDQDESNETKL